MPSVPSVLVVEDDAVLRQLLGSALGGRYRVAMASSAEEALERIAEGAFDLLVLDVDLPGMSGLELLEEVRRTRPAQRFLVVSGVLGSERTSWLSARRVPYLEKPYRLRVLLERIEEVLDRGGASEGAPRSADGTTRSSGRPTDKFYEA